MFTEAKASKITRYKYSANSSGVITSPSSAGTGHTITISSSCVIPGTHFVTFVADTRGKLTEAIMAMQNSKDMSAYIEAVGESREIEGINMQSEIQRWTGGS